MRQRPAEIRIALKAAGFTPVACIGKDAILPHWRDRNDATPEAIARWPGGNTGVDTKFNPGLDIDFDEADAAAGIEAAARDWFDGRGTIPVRFGRAPRRALLFRTSAPFAKIVAKFVAPNGSKHKIEFLGDGQQLIAHGIHPDTKARYSWHADLCPWNMKHDDLVEIDEAEAHAFIDYVAEMLREQFGFDRVSDGNGHDANSPFSADMAAMAGDPIEALAALDPTDGEQVNATYCRVIPELLKQGEHPGAVLNQVVDAAMAAAGRAGLAWSRAEEIKRVVATILSQYRNLSILLRDYDPTTGAIPDCLPGEFHEAWLRVLAAGGRPMMHFNRAGFCIKSMWKTNNTNHTAATAAAPPEIAQHKHESSKNSSGGTPNSKPERRTPATFVLRPFVPFDPATLPPRQWLYGKHYQRRTVSATIAPGGVGKSSLDLVEAIAMATCRNLLGEQPEERLRVWYHNGEDNLDEIRRRICAICQHYDIPQSELQGWLWVTTGSEFPLRVAQGYSNLVINEILVRQISAAIADNAIDVAILDPLVTLHSVSEQDNNKMDAIIRIFFGIADAHDCAFELAHHTRKLPPGSTADYTMDDGRGASATGDALRAARVLNRMSTKDAEDAGLGEVERLSRFRVDRAKGNYSAPAAATTWRQFLSVTLPNRDEVGVVAPWNFPGQGHSSPEKTAAEQTAESIFVQLLVRLTMEGRTVSDKAGTNYAPHVFSQEREAKAAKIGKRPLADAMRRLFASNRIRVEQNERKGRGVSSLVVA